MALKLEDVREHNRQKKSGVEMVMLLLESIRPRSYNSKDKEFDPSEYINVGNATDTLRKLSALFRELWQLRRKKSAEIGVEDDRLLAEITNVVRELTTLELFLIASRAGKFVPAGQDVTIFKCGILGVKKKL